MTDSPAPGPGGCPPGRRHGSGLRRVAGTLGVVGLSAVLAGCGGASSSTAPAAAPVPAVSSTSDAANPDAPEVNAAGDIPDNQVFVPFSPAGGGFTVAVPQGWARSVDGAATVFTDKFNSVRVESLPAALAPGVASARASEVPQLQQSTSGFVLEDVRAVQRSAGEAVLVTYQAMSAPNSVTGKTVTESVERYEFWKAGHEVVLTLSGPKGADNVDPWKKITDSFRWQ